MYSTIIFDLSEVLISGTIGVENALEKTLGIDKETILQSIYSPKIFDLFQGKITEKCFFETLLAENDWGKISVSELESIFRDNFKKKVIGMEEILNNLKRDYELVLLSDHAREWVKFIKTEHGFFSLFSYQFFSYETGHLKQEPITYSIVLSHIGKDPDKCLFIDDMESNIKMAQSIGINGLQFINSEKLTKDLFSLGLLST
jgi:HAD superfamily hydrolase (TIGR01509 family)